MDCSEVKVHTGSKGPEKSVTAHESAFALNKAVRLSVCPSNKSLALRGVE